jgi:hypothetical protein
MGGYLGQLGHILYILTRVDLSRVFLIFFGLYFKKKLCSLIIYLLKIDI